MSIERRYCSHPVVSFQSGDYYVMCRTCDARWVCCGIKNDDPMPDLANKGPPVCDQIRITPPQGVTRDE